MEAYLRKVMRRLLVCRLGSRGSSGLLITKQQRHKTSIQDNHWNTERMSIMVKLNLSQNCAGQPKLVFPQIMMSQNPEHKVQLSSTCEEKVSSLFVTWINDEWHFYPSPLSPKTLICFLIAQITAGPMKKISQYQETDHHIALLCGRKIYIFDMIVQMCEHTVFGLSRRPCKCWSSHVMA